MRTARGHVTPILIVLRMALAVAAASYWRPYVSVVADDQSGDNAKLFGVNARGSMQKGAESSRLNEPTENWSAFYVVHDC